MLLPVTPSECQSHARLTTTDGKLQQQQQESCCFTRANALTCARAMDRGICVGNLAIVALLRYEGSVGSRGIAFAVLFVLAMGVKCRMGLGGQRKCNCGKGMRSGRATRGVMGIGNVHSVASLHESSYDRDIGLNVCWLLHVFSEKLSEMNVECATLVWPSSTYTSIMKSGLGDCRGSYES